MKNKNEPQTQKFCVTRTVGFLVSMHFQNDILLCRDKISTLIPTRQRHSKYDTDLLEMHAQYTLVNVDNMCLGTAVLPVATHYLIKAYNYLSLGTLKKNLIRMT